MYSFKHTSYICTKQTILRYYHENLLSNLFDYSQFITRTGNL